MSKRALRRHHQERFEARSRKFETRCFIAWYDYEERLELIIKKRTTTRCPCSCAGCGNPRRHESGSYKLTIQERRVGSLQTAIREYESE